MKTKRLHDWNRTPAEAIALQKEMAGRVLTAEPDKVRYRLVAGADVSCSRFSRRLFCGVVVYDRRTGAVVERAGVATDTQYPYIPGLLSFRETPGLLAAFERLTTVPDAVLVDGAGVAHPRRFGLASHLGLFLDLPTVGCAKSRLIGEHEQPAAKRGSYRRLTDRGEVIGRVLRTRDGVRPLFISVGHKISLPTATRLVLGCCRGFRQPEPTRLAHQFVNELRQRENAAP